MQEKNEKNLKMQAERLYKLVFDFEELLGLEKTPFGRVDTNLSPTALASRSDRIDDLMAILGSIDVSLSRLEEVKDVIKDLLFHHLGLPMVKDFRSDSSIDDDIVLGN